MKQCYKKVCFNEKKIDLNNTFVQQTFKRQKIKKKKRKGLKCIFIFQIYVV